MGEDELKFAQSAVVSACQILYEGFHASDTLKIDTKDDQSFVTSLDNRLNDHIAELCRAKGVLLLSEEEGSTARHGDDEMYVLDPVDGTGDLVMASQTERGVSIGGVSLGLWRKRPVLGVVGFALLGSPTVLYSAYEGQGAWREIHGKREQLHVDPHQSKGIVLITAKENAEAEYLLRRISELGLTPLKIDGAVFKSCAVADPDLLRMYKQDHLTIPDGTVVGYISYGVHLHDVAAAACIVREAGGVTSDVVNAEGTQAFAAAVNREVYEQLVEILGEDRAD